MSAHRTLDGTWVTCAAVTGCELPFHVELSPAEAQALPERLFEQLAEAADPPHRINNNRWTPTEFHLRHWLDAERRPHRDYDLPATIREDGRRMWFHHGSQHRAGDKPARVDADGHMEWWVNGGRHREGGKPAIIEADGAEQYWENGQFIRRVPD
jgi:hypothetical protein